MNDPHLFGRVDACGVVGCTSTEKRHTHTGTLIRGERVVLQPRTLGAPAACFTNARAVILDARPDGRGHIIVKLDNDGSEMSVNRRDVTRARTWSPPSPRRRGTREGGQRPEAVDPKLGEEIQLPFGAPHE